jgi:hypothetical protein
MLLVVLGTTVDPYTFAQAYADTTELECSREDLAVKLFLRLDLTAGTVAYWHRPTDPAEAPSVKADITKSQVNWTELTDGANILFTLDRTTLSLSEVLPEGQVYSWNCAKTAPPPQS